MEILNSKQMGEVALNFARMIDSLVMTYFLHKGLQANQETFKKLKRVSIPGQETNYYYKNELIITIYPFDKDYQMDYKLHYLEEGV